MENNDIDRITIYYDNYGNYYINKSDAFKIRIYNRKDDLKGRLRITKERVRELNQNPKLIVVGIYEYKIKRPLYIYFNEYDSCFITTIDAKVLNLPNINEELEYYKLSSSQRIELSNNKSLALDYELRLEHEKEWYFHDKDTNTMILYTLEEPNWSQKKIEKPQNFPYFDMRVFFDEKTLRELGITDSFDLLPLQQQKILQHKLQNDYNKMIKINIDNLFRSTELNEINPIKR